MIHTTSGPVGRRLAGGRPGAGGLAAAVVAAVTITGLAVLTAPSAGAASAPAAQSVGRYLDGTLGGSPLQSVADVADARATAPGTQSTQNPLDVTALGKINAPLTGKFTFSASPVPGSSATAGGVNQVAVAHTDGYSFGASGAVDNSGGVSAGSGSNGQPPTAGTASADGSGLPGNTLPLPGAGSSPALGTVTTTVGAVAALARTASGGAVLTPRYDIAGLGVTMASPALGAALGQLAAALASPIPSPLPGQCSIPAQVLTPFSLAGGAVTVSPAGTLTVDLARLLGTVGLTLNQLPANTDLLAYLVHYLSSPGGLAAGLQRAITGAVAATQANFASCLGATPAGPLLAQVQAAQAAFAGAVNGLTGALGSAGGSDPLAPLGTGLAQVLDIGVNVESGPGIQAVQANPAYRFATRLAATPDQATAVVPNQTLVRAVEIHLLGGAAAVVAMGNAAAGPSSPARAASPGAVTGAAGPAGSSAGDPAAGPGGAALPTGVNAGHGTPTSPVLPVTLLTAGLLLAAGAVLSAKLRRPGA